MRFIFILFLFLSSLSAQNYLWPTNASNNLSSSFCEYRPGHYHAAIDIKTWNREGYPCYAVADGKIERIRVSPFGAGKSLYIRLNDGNTAVYFHLQKYIPRLEKEIREIQLQEKRYSVEFWPQNIYVKKGEIVAYSGQTGIGVPHLHFEIRDKKNTPINPLQFYPQVKDAIRPRLDQLLFIPQDEKSHVNNTFLPQALSLKYIRNGVYVLDEPVYAHGRIGLAIKGYDQADGVSNKLGFYATELSVDGRKVFSHAYDRISFRDTRMVDIDIFYPERSRSGRRFNKLFVEPFNTLDFYRRELGNGLINVTDSSRNFEIAVKDYFGNTSIVKGTIQNGLPQAANLEQASVLNKTAYLKLLIPEKLSKLAFYSGPNSASLKPVEYFEIIEREPADSGVQALIKLKLTDDNDRFIRSIIENGDGFKNSTMAVLEPLENQEINVEVRLLGKFLYFMFSDITDSEKLRILFQQQDSIFSDRLRFNGSIAEYVLPARRISSETVDLIIKDESQVYLDTLLSISRILPRENQTFSFFGDSLIISSQYESVYDTLLFRVSKKSISDTLFDLPVSGQTYTIDAGDEILNRGVMLAIKSDSSFFSDGRAAIFSLNDTDIDFSGGRTDYGNYIKKHLKKFNSYIIAADTVAPEIAVFSPKQGVNYTKVPSISFSVEDTISGLGSDKNIEVFFDDQYVVPEWDPERDIVQAYVHFQPAAGLHSVTVKVKDQAGNETMKKIDFNIR